MDFENVEALTLALQRMRAGKPIVVRDEKDGGLEVLWTPEDESAVISSSEGEGDGEAALGRYSEGSRD